MENPRKSRGKENTIVANRVGDKIPLSPQSYSYPTPDAAPDSSHTSRDSIGTPILSLALTSIKETMERSVNFKPARYYAGKISYVSYYVMDPRCGTFKRQRIKVNHIPEKDRARYAAEMVNAINARLFAGWNPIVEEVAARGNDTLHSAMEYYKNNFMPSRPDSVRSYNSIIKTFLTWIDSTGVAGKTASTFDQSGAIRFMKDITARKLLAPRTYNNYLTVLHTIFNVLAEYQYVLENPFKGLPKKKVKGKNREAVPDDILAMVKQKILQTDPRFHNVLMLIYYCGIRPTEITKLRISDFRFDHSLVQLKHHQTKNGRDATVSIPEDMLVSLMHHCSNYPPHFYLFGKNKNLEPGDEPLNPRRLSKHWDKLRKRLNLPVKYKLYSMKDTGATEMAGKLSPIELKNQMRHQNLGITEIYMQKAKPVANPNIVSLKGKL